MIFELFMGLQPQYLNRNESNYYVFILHSQAVIYLLSMPSKGRQNLILIALSRN